MGWNNKYLDVDIQKKNLLRIEVNQADDVFFHINLYDNGKPLDLVNGEDTVIINFVNANNTITADSNIGKNFNKNLLEIYLNKNCTNSYGVAKMQVTINTTKKDVTNKQVTTFPIEIKVNKSIIDGQEVSENVNSMIDAMNSANVKGQQIINNIKDTADKYPASSQLYADVEDLKVREYGGENLLLDSGFLSGNIGSGFPWNVYNSNTTAITVASDSAFSGKSVKITSATGEAGIRQYIDYSRDLKSAYTVSLRVYGSVGTIIKISLESAQTISYTIKSKNTWEDVIVTFDTNINKWNKGFVIVSSEATSFYVQDVALWEGKNAFTYKANSNECLYDRIRISGQDVLGITKSGKYEGVNCINNPFGDTVSWAYYDIDVHSTTYKKIVAKSYHSSLVYENTMNNGTWSGWEQLTTQTLAKNPANITQDSTHRFVTDTEKNKWNNASNYKSETFEPVTKKGIGIDSTGFNNLEGIFAVENKTNLSTLHIVVNGNSIGTVNVGGTGFIRYTAVRTSASWVISTVGKFSASGSEDINKIDIITPSNGEIMALGLDTQSSDTLKGRCTVRMW